MLDALHAIISMPEVARTLFVGEPAQGMDYLQPTPLQLPAQTPLVFAAINGAGHICGGGRLEQRGISYFIHPADQGGGGGLWLAAALVRMQQARCPAQAVEATVHRENGASLRIVQKLGFRFEGMLSGARGLCRYTY